MRIEKLVQQVMQSDGEEMLRVQFLLREYI